MKIAAQLYTVRDFTSTPQGIHETLRKISAIGYKAVQLSALGEIDIDTLKQYLDEFSLTVCATHTPLDSIINSTEAVIAMHKKLCCKYIGLGYLPNEYERTKDGYDRFIADITPAVDMIYQSGLHFVYHNHSFEFARVDGTKTGIDYLCSKFPPEKMGLLLDLYWAQVGGVDVCRYIERYKDRIDVVHFKDMKIVDGKQCFAEIYEGNMPYRDIYDTCVKTGVEWAAVEQDDCGGIDPFKCLKISLDNIRGNNTL